MGAALTAAVLLLITIAAYVTHRRSTQHAERTTLRTYIRPPTGRWAAEELRGAGTPLPGSLPPASPADRHDHRDGGRGRFRARRRRDRPTHKRAR